MRKTISYHLKLAIFFTLVLSLGFLKGEGQAFNPISIEELSTGSVYDLLADSRGFIWIAHETGISRYDGNSFTHFRSDQQTNLAMTDIIEDRQGRIWCHNFNGQLFYIDREKMTLLRSYDNTREKSFQRIVLLGNELLATSDKGLFICNTSNLQCRIATYPTPDFSKTIAVAGNKAITVGDKWFSYQKNAGLRPLKIDPSLHPWNFVLQPLVTSDTIYAIENRNNSYCACKLIVRNDSLIVANRICHRNKINTITQDEGQTFINTSFFTELTDYSMVAQGLDLTDAVTDRQGNRWYGSLQKGLLFERRIGMWRKIACPELKQGDYIKSLTSNKTLLIYGTNNGYISLKDVTTGKTTIQIKLPETWGSIQNMFCYCSNGLIVAPSTGLFLFDTESGRMNEIITYGTIKKVAASDSSFLLAYSDSLTSFPLNPYTAKLFEEDAIVNVKQVANDCAKLIVHAKNLRAKRCKYVCYDKKQKLVYASFLDGVFSWHHGTFNLLQHNSETAYALSLVESADKIIISSFKGLFFTEKDKVVPFNQINKLKSDIVTSLKAYKQYLFLIEKDELQVFDIRTETLLSTIPLPDEYNGLVYNIEMIGDQLYLANASGLYNISFSAIQNRNEKPPVNYLLTVTANNRNITYENPVLKHAENNLAFTFAAPGFIFPSHTFFNYQLKGSEDTSWHKMKEAEFTLSFASLKPGDYTLNAYAVNYRMQKAATPLSFHFIINRQWWQHAWFAFLVFAVTAVVLYLIILFRFKAIRSRTREKELQQQHFETELLQSQIAVQEQERKRIAEDLHDDIGATLSALHLHISNIPEHSLLQSSELQQFYLQSLLLASKAADDVRGISHDLLPKDFSELGLFAVLQNRVDELNATHVIQFTFITDGNEKQLNNIYSITIYRIVNELISNIIKHSQAQEALIQVLINETETQIIAEDNGIGIHIVQSRRGIGMKNIQSRINFLKGTIHMDSSEKGTAIIITIPME